MKWEYRFIHLDHLALEPDMGQILNRLGNDGWELVAVISNAESNLTYTAFFKRPATAG